MEITPATNTTANPATTTASNAATISSDFETFLTLLTAQMQYQDPLNPVDSTDYATQLATFSQVEQSVLTNELLTSLSAQLTSDGLAGMANWVGKEARAAAPAYFDGQPVTLAPNPAVIADRAEVIVRNESGVEVQRFDIPVTAEPIEWAGVGPGGTPFANGMYSFELLSIASGEVIRQDPIELYSTVAEVRAQDGQTVLVLRGGAVVSTNEVTALRDPNL